MALTCFITGCTTKSKVVDGQRYTQTFGSNEWQYAGEAKPVENNSSKPEESVGYVAGQIAGALVTTGAHIITSPIRAVETVSKTDSNSSKTTTEKSENYK